MTATVQQHFSVSERLKRRLARVETAMNFLDLTEDGVLERIEEGWLVAFNLAAHGARARLPCIWWRSILDYHARADREIIPASMPTESALLEILPAGNRALNRGELMRLLGIKSSLFNHHIHRGLLVAQGTSRGPVTRASVAAFLELRRM